MSAGAGSSSERVMADSTGRFTGVWRVVAEASLLAPQWRPGYPPGGQAELSCLASWLVIATLRGLAASCTGMARVSTPAV
jgi:hypothetical protein